MKKAIILFFVIIIIPLFGFSQSIENLDYISPFHDDIAVVKKENQWAFINNKGDIIVDFRDDLVTTKFADANYPIFSDERCLIKQIKDGISYFGYIDTSGKTIIEPQFLNAANFSNGKAIVLELVKELVGENKALGKNVVYHKYYEATIDTNGEIKNYLTQKAINIVLDKEFTRKPPQIISKHISDNLFAVKYKNNKWTIITINE
ncbi:MAG: hypothetical protein ACJARX_001805 [Psychroserpens sp.]|jgi:hypothetical protein|uniref:WG repeat-containing protein n=1 Tax=Psychroserpens sp. TaxID=2020870 RepID=UPI0039E44ADE